MVKLEKFNMQPKNYLDNANFSVYTHYQKANRF